MPCRRSNTRDEPVLAINLGGALIPLALSVFLLVKHEIYAEAAVGVAIMAVITYLRGETGSWSRHRDSATAAADFCCR